MKHFSYVKIRNLVTVWNFDSFSGIFSSGNMQGNGALIVINAVLIVYTKDF
jgi:hypothetical protein